MTLYLLVIVRGRLSHQALFTNMAVEIGLTSHAEKTQI